MLQIYKKILFISLIALCADNLYSMKRQLSMTLHQKNKKTKFDHFSQEYPLPFELQEHIFLHCVPKQSALDNFNIVCASINAISYINKRWHDYINNPQTIRIIINTINDYSEGFPHVGQYEIAKKIETSGAKNYIFQSSALYHKIKGHFPVSPYSIRNLVERGADAHFKHLKGPLLFLAIKNKHYTYTKELLDHGADINTAELGKTPLHVAIKEELLPIIELLLQYTPIQKCLLVALKKGNAAIMKLLLEKAHLTRKELHPAYLYSLRTSSSNAAAQILLSYHPTI